MVLQTIPTAPGASRAGTPLHSRRAARRPGPGTGRRHRHRDAFSRANALHNWLPHMTADDQPAILARHWTPPPPILNDSGDMIAGHTGTPSCPGPAAPGTSSRQCHHRGYCSRRGIGWARTPACRPALLSQALKAATAITDDHSRAVALIGLAPHLSANEQPAIVAQALNAAAITDESFRARRVGSIGAPPFPALAAPGTGRRHHHHRRTSPAARRSAPRAATLQPYPQRHARAGGRVRRSAAPQARSACRHAADLVPRSGACCSPCAPGSDVIGGRLARWPTHPITAPTCPRPPSPPNCWAGESRLATATARRSISWRSSSAVPSPSSVDCWTPRASNAASPPACHRGRPGST